MDAKMDIVNKMWTSYKYLSYSGSITIVDTNGNSLLNNTTSASENTISEKDICLLSKRLEEKGKCQIFSTKMNKSNYFCVINGTGLLTARGNFNSSDNQWKIGRANGRKQRKVHEIQRNLHENGKNSNEKQQLADAEICCRNTEPLLVAVKVCGLIVIITGNCNSQESVVNMIKEVASVLKEESIDNDLDI